MRRTLLCFHNHAVFNSLFTLSFKGGGYDARTRYPLRSAACFVRAILMATVIIFCLLGTYGVRGNNLDLFTTLAASGKNPAAALPPFPSTRGDAA
jgi:hypothetical protein